MREVEFRGKDITTNKWVYGGYYKHLKRTPCPIGDNIKDKDCEHLIMISGFSDWNMPKPIDCFIVDEKTVGQYTGLRDKNGKKIYEGDILIQYDGTKRFVGYKNGSFTYTNIPKLEQTHNTFSMFYTEFTNPISKEWEVISNIYDNPELLELEGE